MNSFLLENEETSRELKELDTKNTRAAEELEENQKAYEQTKVEYDRLEEELEQLNSQMDQLREETQNKAIRRQQLDGETKVLREQILSGVQSEEHYKSRLQTIEADLKERQESLERQEAEKSQLHAALLEARKRQEAARGPDFQYSGTDRRVFPGSGEWQERDYRASQYPCHYQRKSPAFRYHDGADRYP